VKARQFIYKTVKKRGWMRRRWANLKGGLKMETDLILIDNKQRLALGRMDKDTLVSTVTDIILTVAPRPIYESFLLKESVKSLAPATLLTYVDCVKAVTRAGLAFPVSEQQLVTWIDTQFSAGLAPSTIAQRMAAIGKLHEWLGVPSPVTKDARLVFRNRYRAWAAAGNRQRQARALLKRDLLRMLDAVDGAPVKVLRDTAMILIGYSGAFRRSELCGIRFEHLEFDDYGVKIWLPTTKTAKFGDSKRILSEPQTSEVCPVRILRAWLKAARITTGAVWRPINRHGHVGAKQITTHGFNFALKALAEKAGLDPAHISGHSLRAGVCTQLAIDGVPTYKIQRLGAWANLHMLHERYLREVEMMTDNAAAALWKDTHLGRQAARLGHLNKI
jgi:integrase